VAGALARRILVALMCSSAFLAVVAAHPQALPLSAPVHTKVEIQRFLATAKIVGSHAIPRGVTQPVRLTLTDGVTTHDAAFSTVDERLPIMRYKSGRTELNFVDSYQDSIAAYRIAELLGLDDMMPVTVERRWEGHKGALTWWLDAMMDEGDRLKAKIEPPDREAWNWQMHRMRVFVQLVADTDRNVGNLLIGHDWQIWMIDFTRAFRLTHDLISPNELVMGDRRLLDRLRALDKGQLKEATKPYLGGAEIDALLARRDHIIDHFSALVAAKGEAQVLY
jgi:hypothetical protein